ncbi:DMT family transporter [Peribacillus saganii]|uniref:DMT family transporter n=2 Tax=Peribacillus saganii TaxID=2303992 RepID=A0A372LPF8_9BACI|nr:DMT family transporter [Peribacillus saganii]
MDIAYLKEVKQVKQKQIYLILFCVMISWGLNVIATKILVTNFMPVTMTAFRIFLGGVSVFIILSIIKKVRMLTKKEFIYVFIGGLFNVVVHHYFLAVGLSETSASNGGLILGLGPILTAVLAVLFLGSTMTVIRAVGFLLGITGVGCIVLQSGGGFHGIASGDVSVFLSVLSQAISFVLIAKVSKTLDPRLMTGYMLVMGSVILFFISLALEPEGLASMQNASIGLWALFFASAVIATALGHMLYNFSMGKVGAAEASIFINLSPFFSLIGSVIFLKEKIAAAQLIGFVFILIGVVLGSGGFEELIRKRKRNQQMNMKKKYTV